VKRLAVGKAWVWSGICGLAMATVIPSSVPSHAAPVKGFGERLPDRTDFTLEKVTFGREHRYKAGGSGRRGADYASRSESIVFWVRQRNIKQLTDGGMLYPSLSDSDGCNAAPVGTDFEPRTTPMQPIPEGRPDGRRALVRGYAFPAFPRRSETLTLRLYGQDDEARWHRIVEFSVPNPAKRPYEQWRPDGMPIVKRWDGLEVTLVNAWTNVHAGHRDAFAWMDSRIRSARVLRPALPGEPSATVLGLSIKRDSAPAPGWYFRAVTVRSAAGDEWSPASPTAFTLVDRSQTQVKFPGSLWSCEDAWRIELVLTNGSAGSAAREKRFEFVCRPERLMTLIPMLPAAAKADDNSGVDKNAAHSRSAVRFGRLLPLKVRLSRACDAAGRGDRAALRRLLDSAVSFAAQDRHGTPLVAYAAPKVLPLLLARGANVDQCDRYGRTPLLLAAVSGNAAAAQAYLQHGADVHAKDIEDSGALHLAVLGTLPFGSDGQGGDANWALCEFLSRDRRSFVKDTVAVLNLLRRAGADPEETDVWGSTALALGRLRGLRDPEILTVLSPGKVTE
jgi:hypothetical protein